MWLVPHSYLLGLPQKPPGGSVIPVHVYGLISQASVSLDLRVFSDHKSISSPRGAGKSARKLMSQKKPVTIERQEFTDNHPSFLLYNRTFLKGALHHVSEGSKDV